HGLKRAWLVADRLIWRLMADPCENEWGSPSEGLVETVCTDEGEVFWRVEPAMTPTRPPEAKAVAASEPDAVGLATPVPQAPPVHVAPPRLGVPPTLV